VCVLWKSWAAISGFDKPDPAHWAICASWGGEFVVKAQSGPGVAQPSEAAVVRLKGRSARRL
jgi:hypothetical protein